MPVFVEHDRGGLELDLLAAAARLPAENDVSEELIPAKASDRLVKGAAHEQIAGRSAVCRTRRAAGQPLAELAEMDPLSSQRFPRQPIAPEISPPTPDARTRARASGDRGDVRIREGEQPRACSAPRLRAAWRKQSLRARTKTTSGNRVLTILHSPPGLLSTTIVSKSVYVCSRSEAGRSDGAVRLVRRDDDDGDRAGSPENRRRRRPRTDWPGLVELEPAELPEGVARSEEEPEGLSDHAEHLRNQDQGDASPEPFDEVRPQAAKLPVEANQEIERDQGGEDDVEEAAPCGPAKDAGAAPPVEPMPQEVASEPAKRGRSD